MCDLLTKQVKKLHAAVYLIGEGGYMDMLNEIPRIFAWNIVQFIRKSAITHKCEHSTEPHLKPGIKDA